MSRHNSFTGGESQPIEMWLRRLDSRRYTEVKVAVVYYYDLLLSQHLLPITHDRLSVRSPGADPGGCPGCPTVRTPTLLISVPFLKRTVSISITWNA